MRQILAVAALVLLACPIAQAQGTRKAEDAILELKQEWTEAFRRHDPVAVERIEADDFIYIAPNGHLTTKDHDIENAKDAEARIDAYEFDEVKVRVFGDTAVLTGRVTLKGQHHGFDISGQYRTTDVWVKRAGRWQVISSQATAIFVPSAP